MKIKRLVSLALCVILLAAVNATAHYTFIVPEKFRVSAGQTLTIGFHASDGFPESTQVPKRLQSAFFHAAGKSVAIPNLREEGLRQVASASVPAGHIILTAVNPAATASMRPNSFLDYLKEENLAHVIEAREKLGENEKPGRERYSMYLKSIVLAGAPDDGYKNVVGLPIEIVPEIDPYQLRSGESLPVRVLFRGMPAANLELFAASVGKKNQSIGRTDSNGRVSVPVSTGLWRLHTIHMVRVSEPEVDWESFWATLTFEIP